MIDSLTPYTRRDTLAATEVNPEVASWAGFLVEAWLTSILVLTILGATDDQRKPVYMPSLPIGMAVAVDIMAGVSIVLSVSIRDYNIKQRP